MMVPLDQKVSMPCKKKECREIIKETESEDDKKPRRSSVVITDHLQLLGKATDGFHAALNSNWTNNRYSEVSNFPMLENRIPPEQ